MSDANHEIDIQVAEAMGWERYVSADHTNDKTPLARSLGIIYGWKQHGKLMGVIDVPKFSTSLASAWEVIEYQRKEWPQTVGRPAKYWQFVSLRDGLWSVMIREENATIARVIARDTGPFPLAVCRCFLMARAPRGEEAQNNEHTRQS